MKLHDTPDAIITQLASQYPELPAVLADLKASVPQKVRQIAEYQAAALYALLKPYNKRGVKVLEIGTFLGYSAMAMAKAAPLATITTLNPLSHEAEEARRVLAKHKRITVLEEKSWDYLAANPDSQFDVVFVDGDHKRIRADLPWWDHLKPGGLFLFHDYSPPGSPRQCPPVYDALNEFARMLGCDFDVLIVDNTGVGMAGFYKTDAKPLAEHHRDWVMFVGHLQEHTIHTPARLNALWHVLKTVDVPGTLADVGSANGGIGLLMAKALPGRLVRLFDTFSTVPVPTAEDGDKAAYKYQKNRDSLKAGNLETVARLYEGVEYQAYAGLLANTLPLSRDEPIAVLHIDCDWYTGTKQALEHLYQRLSPGGVVVISAYDHWTGSRKAVDEFRSQHKIKTPLQHLEGPAVWWRKA